MSRAIAVFIAATGASVAPTALADHPFSSEVQEVDEWSWGMQIGYGHGVRPRKSQQDADVGEVRLFALLPHLRMPLGRAGDPDRWYHGRFDGLLEAQLLINGAPSAGVGGGVLAGLRYVLRPEARWQPLIEIGAGLGGLDFDLETQSDGFVFLLQGGVGTRYRLTDTLDLVAALRWHHITNAQTAIPNTGIDDLLLTVGAEF